MPIKENKPEKHLHVSSLGTRKICLDEFAEVVGECSEANWDGYKAVPLGAQAISKARHFINALPSDHPYPEIGVMPDGDVSLDWDLGPRRSLTVVIGPQARLVYAMINADEERSGTLSFIREIPKPLLSTIQELSSFR